MRAAARPWAAAKARAGLLPAAAAGVEDLHLGLEPGVELHDGGGIPQEDEPVLLLDEIEQPSVLGDFAAEAIGQV